MTLERLAKQFGVNSRTIKTDMAALAAELPEYGAKLVSLRNRSYSLMEMESEASQPLYTITNIKVGGLNSHDERTRLLHVARKLVASRRGAGGRDGGKPLFELGRPAGAAAVGC